MDTDKIHAAVFLIGLVVAGMLFGGWLGFRVGLEHCEPCVEGDTVFVTRTDTCWMRPDTVEVTNTVLKPYYLYVHDTVSDTVTMTDSVFVTLPIDYKHWRKKDTLDIWYHGFDADIDSVRNVVYTNERHVTEIVRPRNVATVYGGTDGVGGGYSRLVGDRTMVGAYYRYDMVGRSHHGGVSVGLSF